MSLKNAVFLVAQRLGVFDAATRATSDRLTILCYHGFSMGDEHRFRPGLFMRPELFAERLDWLVANQFRVLPLADACARLREGRLEPRSVAITIDDGFHGVAAAALPLLRARGLPATVYVTTYYVQHHHPIFRLALQYFFWRAGDRTVDLGGLGPDRKGEVRADSVEGSRALWELIEFGESQDGETSRVAIAHAVAKRTGCSYESLVQDRTLTLMTEDEIRTAVADGFDIQLHTHRHRFPERSEEVTREIEDNRAVLEPLVGKPLRHLCYPSGVWSPERWPALREAGIETATTCEPGMNRATTEPLSLRRFLDRDDMPRIVFEAELSGFGEVWLGLRRLLRGS